MSHPSCISAIVALSLMLGPHGIQAIQAQTVFRSTDSWGNPLFTDNPPPNSGRTAEPITVQPLPRIRTPAAGEGSRPGPPPGAPADAAQGATGQADPVEAARRALAEAQAALVLAEEIRDDDWQTLVSGGRVLSHRYFARLAEAEAAVQSAEAELARLNRRR